VEEVVEEAGKEGVEEDVKQVVENCCADEGAHDEEAVGESQMSRLILHGLQCSKSHLL
jgi:hypothetical protein